MKIELDLEAILAPIPGENPAGENLRYTPVYDEIKEARREEDMLNLGDWNREIKRADWEKVIKLSIDVLTKKTKDLQIAAWLTEALIKTQGFTGLTTGLKIITGFLKNYWDHLYPEIEDGDLDFRVGPLEFMNNTLSITIKQIPLTDTKVTPGYSWLKWQESRAVGYEKDTLNQYGDVDENKKRRRDELIADGKLTAEDFDSAVARSSKEYFESLASAIAESKEEFKILDETVDEKFGSNAPRLAEMREAIEECERLTGRILKEKRGSEPEPEPEPETEEELLVSQVEEKEKEEEEEMQQPSSQPASVVVPATNKFSSTEGLEKAMWEDALKRLKSGGIQKALRQLYEVSCSMPSIREKNRYRLLMAKLCLKAERPDLARPIVEELYTLIEELHLDRWESPMWIAEVLEALYQCLTAGTPSDDDMYRAQELFKKICTMDVTKAMIYKH
jgi:type VI secretion system protein ImpA